jgi:tRNA/rRNA methyltransferase
MSAPAVILVRPQLGENIGAAARAMKNFGFGDMRIVAPRDGWPNPAAEAMAVGAVDVLEAARFYDTAAEAVADLELVWATTARRRYMLKPVLTPRRAIEDMRTATAGGQRCGILFGPERTGLENDEVALADAMLRVPTAPGFASLNLAQAVLLIGYEWFQHEADLPEEEIRKGRTELASKGEVEGFFEHLIGELDTCGFLRNAQQRPSMIVNLRNIFLRAGLYEQEVRTLRGVITCLVHGRRPIPGREEE